jgi:hypothetical protein
MDSLNKGAALSKLSPLRILHFSAKRSEAWVLSGLDQHFRMVFIQRPVDAIMIVFVNLMRGPHGP